MIEFEIEASMELSADIANRVMTQWPGTEVKTDDCSLRFQIPMTSKLDSDLEKLEQLFQTVEKIRGIDELNLKSHCLNGPDSCRRQIQIGGFLIQHMDSEKLLDPSEVDGNVHVITLDSGSAFGTGTHPSTMLALEAIEEYYYPMPGRNSRANARVLDAGTGSGILAIAASKLSNGPILGIDTSKEAVKIARGNAAINDVESRIQFEHMSAANITGEYDLVIANLVTSVIVRIGKKISTLLAPDGVMVLSGFGNSQAPQVVKAMTKTGLVCIKSYSYEGWSALAMVRA